MEERKRVALVLGGGGALGFAHIGVIKVLERAGIPIDIVVGTSMGGLIGAAYSAGLTVKEMTELALKFKTIKLADINFDNTGLFSGKGVMGVINKFLPDVNIETLPRTFACVAADLRTEKEVVFKIGSLRDAVRSTISIPGVFVPFRKDNMFLIDGGAVNNLPEDIAMEMGADIIISCDVLSQYKMAGKPKSIIDSLFLSMNIAIKEIEKYRSVHSDVLIRPKLPGLTPLAFGKENALLAIRRGERATKEQLQNILNLLKAQKII